MRFDKLGRLLFFVLALIVLCGAAGPAMAGFNPTTIENIPANIPAFVGEFQSFLADFPRWDAAKMDLPFMILALTPEQERPEVLLLLWDLWMQDRLSSSGGAGRANPASAGFIPFAESIPANFSHWKAAQPDLTQTTLAPVPEQQQPGTLLPPSNFGIQDPPNPSSGNSQASGSFPEGEGGGPEQPHHAVPEPASLALVACAMLGLVMHRLVRSLAARIPQLQTEGCPIA